MSTKQSESAHSQGKTQAAHSPVDITQQAKTTTPTTMPAKNLNRVAAGKRVAEKTRQAREEHKGKAAEYEAIMGNNNAKANENHVPTPVDKQPTPAPGDESGNKNNGLSITQWLALGIFVIYDKVTVGK